MEAAIARAKARKAEQQAAQQDLASAAANDDPRKAAIARVQARKATQQAVNEE
ncbi:electron transport complex protein RnfC [Klebsiella pneumoniae]|nr:electron transport complex protein RnfC [Klebsiella pneumoniae]